MSSATGTQSRLVSSMDPAVDGLPFDPTIRIPPIHDPSPLQVISSHRPSPLEPNAANTNRPSNVSLDTRAKALASARPLGSDTPIRPLDTSRISNSQRTPQEEDIEQLGPRKRQRTEYVQLPNPHNHNPLERNTSLDTIPRVNELYQPPPSAARFPPITTNTASPSVSSKKPVDVTTTGKPSLETSHSSTSQTAADSPASADEPKKAKRNYTRGRRMWTDEETANLLKGVAKHGVGKWKKILNDADFAFPQDRTAVDLKDRFRTCRLHEERRIERHANGDPCPDEGLFSLPHNAPRNRTRKKKEPEAVTSSTAPTSASFYAPAATATSNAITKTPKTRSKSPEAKPNKAQQGDAKEPVEPQQQQSGISFASVNTVQDMAEELAKKVGSTPHKWSAEDDSNLSRGFQKYGFHWTAISKDPDFSLEDRTGPQLRDRFRVKFPIHYQSSVPIDLPDPAPGYDREQRPRTRRVRHDRPRGGTKVSLTDVKDPKNVLSAAGSAGQNQRSQNMSIANIVKPADAQTPRISRPSLPSMQSLFARVDAQPLPEPSSNTYSMLNIQPLPDEDEDFEDSDYDDADSELNEGDAGSIGEDELVDDYDDGFRTGEDGRHLGISELLNEESDMGATIGDRLPPFKTTYDDLNEDWEEQNNITLPPLLIETARPIFDIRSLTED